MDTSKKTDNPRVEILIVEDSRTQAAELQYLLEQRNYLITIATNGMEALEILRKRKPTLVITDIVMPKMDGYALCSAIKSDRKLKEVPVVIVTSLSGILDIAKGLECGADNFIRKPYDPKMLLARIDYILLNLELRKNKKVSVGMEVMLHGRKHFITSEKEQIIDLLISAYEEAVHMNEELQERQKEIARSHQTLGGLYRIAGELNRVFTEADVCERALQGAMELPNFQAGWIYLQDQDSGLRSAAACNLPEKLNAPGAMEGDCRCRRMLAEGNISASTNILQCDKLQNGGKGGLCFHASTPLMVGDRCLGVMNLTGGEEGSFGDEDMKTLDAVGSQIAGALERTRLYHHLETLVEQRTAALQAEVAERKRAEERVASLNRIYAVLSDINGTIVRVHDRYELFKQACRIAVELGKFKLVWIGLVSPGDLKVKPAAWMGAEETSSGKTTFSEQDIVDDDSGVIGQVVHGKSTFVCNDIKSAPAAVFAKKALERGYGSLVVLPLLVAGDTIGVFALYAAEAGVFDAGELKLLEELAGDISFALDHIDKEERLNYLAYYDALTGLPNRNLFYDRLNQLLQAAGHGKMALLVMNLERFKSINDAFGRNVGDTLLKLVAERLKEVIGSTDRLARIGADHFGAILANLNEEADVARILDDQIIESLGRPFIVGGQELRLSINVGIALAPSDGKDADTLFTNAETALRKAKAAGERYLFYAPQMNARVAEKLSVENRLRTALEKEQFVLHYQPKVDLENGSITGLEALIRWNDPGIPLVPPNLFIPILEETGMILEVGKWALEKAVADYDLWHAKGLNPPRIAVNVSAVQLRQKDFLQTVEKVLAQRKNGHGYLDLEITESLIMENIEENIPRLKRIREMGVKIAVDDFGTGYSSLSYIAKLPIDALKIDRAFIVNMMASPDDATIVSSIISLAHALKYKVIAEGVETEEQSKFLKLLKCDEIQGFACSRPVPFEQMETMLRDRSAR